MKALSTVALFAAAISNSFAQDNALDGAGETTASGSADDADALVDLDDESQSGWWAPTTRGLGLEWESPDGRFSVNPWLRSQLRYSTRFDDDIRTLEDFADAPGGDLDFRRARLKMDVQLGSPEVTLYFEHELSGERPLLALRTAGAGNTHDTRWRLQWDVSF